MSIPHGPTYTAEEAQAISDRRKEEMTNWKFVARGTERLRVSDGWLYKYEHGPNVAIAFVPRGRFSD